MKLLIVIPALNEAAHIRKVIETLLTDAPADSCLVVADGGSTDDTREIVTALGATDARITLMRNPARLQSAGVNLAVERFGHEFDYLLRADAHADYPPHFARTLLQEAQETGAASITVGMETLARGGMTDAIAAAQNSRLGTGGSAHRMGSGGRFVDHGHHALMRIADFNAVGGYDPKQSHNEDAELDHRLRRAGRKVWLSGKAKVGYHPRGSLAALFRQYRAHGRGRAMTVMKHHLRLKPRQMIPALVPVAVALAIAGLVLAPFDAGWLALAVPALIWAVTCLAYGGALALRAGRWPVALAGVAAMAMHLGWGTGFLEKRFSLPAKPRRHMTERP